MTAKDAPQTIDLRKYIDFYFFGERAHIRGKRIPVGLMVRMIRANDMTISTAAHNWSLTEAEILAALLYYEEHADEIDAQEAAEDKTFAAMKQNQENNG